MTIPRRTDPDYVEQMTAEVREERADSRGRIKVPWVHERRDIHYLDREPLIGASGVITEHLKAAESMEPTGQRAVPTQRKRARSRTMRHQRSGRSFLGILRRECRQPRG